MGIESQIESVLDQVENGLRSMMGEDSSSHGNSDESAKNNPMKGFFENQYEIRLANLLKATGSDIHHLESGIKNKIILRKQRFFERFF